MKRCKVRGCKRAYYAKDYCKLHYEHKKKYGRIFKDPLIKRSTTGVCTVPGCDRKHWSNGFCQRHEQQMRKKGYVFGLSDKTKFSPNAHEIHGGICRIFLSDQRANPKGTTMIDIADAQNVLKEKWHLATVGYAVSSNGENLASFILGLHTDKSIVIDHINQDKLDNRRCNLRIVDKSINAFNTKIRTDNTSGYRGVSWDKEKSKWCARITINGKQKQIGRYDNIEDAILARKNAEKE